MKKKLLLLLASVSLVFLVACTSNAVQTPINSSIDIPEVSIPSNEIPISIEEIYENDTEKELTIEDGDFIWDKDRTMIIGLSESGNQSYELYFPKDCEMVSNSCYFGSAIYLNRITFLNPDTKFEEYFSFSNSTVTKIDLPDNLDTLTVGMFSNCYSLTNINIPSNITEIPNSLFKNSGLVSITIPDNITKIGECAFDGCTSLTDVKIGENVVEIGDLAFEACTSLTNITFNNKLQTIGNCVFVRTALESIEIPEGVISIGDNAFTFSNQLKSVTLPSTLESLGEWAFSECHSLTAVTINSDFSSDYTPYNEINPNNTYFDNDNQIKVYVKKNSEFAEFLENKAYDNVTIIYH